MSSVALDSEQYEKHREAGAILAQVREEAAERAIGAFDERTNSEAGVIVADREGATSSAYNSATLTCIAAEL